MSVNLLCVSRLTVSCVCMCVHVSSDVCSASLKKDGLAEITVCPPVRVISDSLTQ